MQWEAGETGGFTVGKPWIEVNKNHGEINVVKSLSDPDSIFFCYQKLIELRKSYRVIQEGGYEPAFLEEEGIFAYGRALEEEKLLVLANFTSRRREIKLNGDFGSFQVLISNDGEMTEDTNKLELGPFGSIMLYEGKKDKKPDKC